MKKTLLVMIAILLTVSFCSMAAEKKPLAEVNTNAFVEDSQVLLEGAGDDHVAFVWWIPKEYWISIFARDKSIPERDRKEMLRILSDVSLVVIAQADISKMGAFRFYNSDEIAQRMKITYVDGEKKRRALAPMQNIGGDLQMLLNMVKPILGAAMGNMGNNMHFFVFDDTDGADRVLDPYEEGRLDVRLATRGGTPIKGIIDLPLNCLYVPRKCPNGRDAHISWNYCPWTGQKLPE
ncbi:MAG: hypothetical protein ACOC95_01330 [Planctomycetota bacterium]